MADLTDLYDSLDGNKLDQDFIVYSKIYAAEVETPTHPMRYKLGRCTVL